MTTLDECQLSVLVAIYFWQSTPGELQAMLHGNVDKALGVLQSLGLCVRRIQGSRSSRWFATEIGDATIEAWDAAGRPDTWEIEV